MSSSESYRKELSLFFVGSYTQIEGHVPNGCGDGICSFWLDSATGKVTPAGRPAPGKIKNPTYLSYQKDTDCLYAVEEIGSEKEFPAHLVSYKIDKTSSEDDIVVLKETSKVTTDLWAGCHLAVREGQLLVASYMSGNLYGVPISKDGNLSSTSAIAYKYIGTGPNAARQEASHAHQVVISTSKNQKYIYVCDLGSDKIWCHDATKPISDEPIHAIECPPGSGPRHMVFHPALDVVYVAAELTGDVLTYQYNPMDGNMKMIDQFNSLPKEFQGDPASGEIQIHPSGTTLYVSNRGFVNEKDNTIVIYPIMPTTGKLVSTNVKWVATGGKTPRDFALDETGRWLLVGNQDSDTLAVFELVEELIEAEEEGNTALVAVKVCKQPPTLYPCKTPACITFAK